MLPLCVPVSIPPVRFCCGNLGLSMTVRFCDNTAQSPGGSMDEVTSILIAVGAMLAGLVFLGWVFGDFPPPKSTIPSKPGGGA